MNDKEPVHIIYNDKKTWCNEDIKDVERTRPQDSHTTHTTHPKDTCKKCLDRLLPW